MSTISDHFMRLLELMARALGAYLNKLIGLKQISPEQARIFANECLQSELDLPVTKIASMDNDEFINLLLVKKYRTNHVELVGKFIFETAEILEDKDEANQLYSKAKLLFEYVSSQDKSFSTERNDKVKKINEILAA